MGIKEGKWRCSYCDAINLGRNAKCQTCQAVRGDDVEFFLDDDEETLVDQELINRAKAGVDWSCDYCQTDNRATDAKCRQCGASRSDGGINRKEKIILDKKEAPSGSASMSPPPTPSKKSPIPAIILGAAVLGLVIFLIYFFLIRTTEDTLVVESGNWERSIGLEEKRWVTKENWDDKLPKNATILSSFQKERSTRKVQVGTQKVKVGTKDLGNGFFEDVYENKPVYEEQPVYDTWVKYRIQEWKEYKRVRTNGKLKDPPAWPAYNLKAGAREGDRRELAHLRFYSSQDKDKKYTYGLMPEKLKDYKISESYSAKINALGQIVSLEKQ